MNREDIAGTGADLRTTLGAPDDLYFVRAGDFVKIGRAKKVIDRVNTLRTGCPIVFGDILIFFGRGQEERAIHRRLAKHRTQGEWFNWHRDVEQEIASLEERSGIAPGVRYAQGEAAWGAVGSLEAHKIG